MTIPIDTIVCGDCLEVMKQIDDKSIDMILCDLPYGVTNRNKWDVIISFDKLWEQYKRISKGAVVLTASQPFTSMLIMSNLEMFKYTWVWDKVNKFSGHLNAKKQPLRQTEDIVVFYTVQPTYNPQMFEGKPYTAVSSGSKSTNYGIQTDQVKTVCEGSRYPRNIIAVKGDERGTVGRIHPTQKPVALFEYLIKTYTNEGDLVLDNCIGSGTTAVAALNTKRHFIGIELSEEYCTIARQRIAEIKPVETIGQWW